MTKFWVNRDGTLNRATSDDGRQPANTVEAAEPPISGKQIYNFSTNKWGAVPPRDLNHLYSRQMTDVFKAFVQCINDGSIVPGANASNADIKTAIKAKL